jgi:hypothetical protein
MKLRSLLAATALAAAAAFGSTASATTYGTIGGPGGGNEYLGDDILGGYFGGDLYLVGGPASITVTIIGSEAGYNNSFTFGGVTYSTGGGTNSFNDLGVFSWDVVGVTSGLLDFVFSTNGGAGSVANGSNQDNLPSIPNFFVSFLPDPTSSFGQSLLLFLDDGAGNGTDNHDDLIVRLDLNGGTIAPVPLPAGGLLLIGALGGLAALRRRKST